MVNRISSSRSLPLAAGLAAGVLVLLAGRALLLGGLEERVHRQMGRLAELREMTARDTARSERLPRLNWRVRVLERRLRQEPRPFPDGAGEAGLQRRIREVAAGRRLAVTQLSPEPVAEGPACRVHSFRCTLSGPFEELPAFFAELQDRLPLLSVEDMRLTEPGSGGRSVQAGFRLRVAVCAVLAP